MADCKACGAWFSSTAPSELCPTCERALKRLNGYAVPVVRCKKCKWSRTNANDHEDVYYCELRTGRAYHSGDFCSYGERREGE